MAIHVAVSFGSGRPVTAWKAVEGGHRFVQVFDVHCELGGTEKASMVNRIALIYTMEVETHHVWSSMVIQAFFLFGTMFFCGQLESGPSEVL